MMRVNSFLIETLNRCMILGINRFRIVRAQSGDSVNCVWWEGVRIWYLGVIRISFFGVQHVLQLSLSHVLRRLCNILPPAMLPSIDLLSTNNTEFRGYIC